VTVTWAESKWDRIAAFDEPRGRPVLSKGRVHGSDVETGDQEADAGLCVTREALGLGDQGTLDEAVPRRLQIGAGGHDGDDRCS